MRDLFIELLQVSLGSRNELSQVPSADEWTALFAESQRQSVVGILYEGVLRLPEDQRPPHMLRLQWIGLSEQIRLRNVELDRQTREIWNRLHNDGLDAAILKGQGIATLYGTLAPLRQGGDIDIWVKGGYDTVCNYVQRTYPTDDVAYHRFHYSFFDDTEVELHHRPTLMRNLFDDRRLARWYDGFGVDDFVYLDSKGFAVPPIAFNRIFILTHIYRHFLFEGIGLRQIIDYYFVLKSDSSWDKEEIGHSLKEFKLTRFAEAVMWILYTQLGLEEPYLICGMSEKEGRFVLGEIEQTGNFGHADNRYEYRRFFKLRRQVAHGVHLLLHYPSEVLWTPIWLMYHKVWKWNKKREIHRSWRR